MPFRRGDQIDGDSIGADIVDVTEDSERLGRRFQRTVETFKNSRIVCARASSDGASNENSRIVCAPVSGEGASNAEAMRASRFTLSSPSVL